jgi:NAD(P)-dependent dehydrogenase (short-subunit alcohol dehydrogenase family)
MPSLPSEPASGPFDLTGRVALVTGASRGIGRATAEAFAAAGARVVLASRKQDALDAVAAAITEAGGEALAVAAHTGDDDAVEALVARTLDAYGGLDVLVNNAATNPHFGPLLSADMGVWDKTLDVNLKGYVRLIRAAVPAMRARGGGSIINLASVAAERPQPGVGVYCVSKAAVLMLTDVLAGELAADGIRVNAVLPGFVKTRFSSALWQDEDLNAAVLDLIPQGRMAEPEEIAALALYLAADASRFMTGAHLRIDGGQNVAAGALA